MKKFFTVLGIIFLCLLVTGAIGFSMVAYQGAKLDKSSQSYVDQIVPIIIASWSPQELLDRASPELLEVAPRDKVDTMFREFTEKLGALKEYRGSKGDSLINFTASGKVVTAAYMARASFGKGDAEIKISIIQHDKKWQLLEFRVNSDMLIN